MCPSGRTRISIGRPAAATRGSAAGGGGFESMNRDWRVPPVRQVLQILQFLPGEAGRQEVPAGCGGQLMQPEIMGELPG